MVEAEREKEDIRQRLRNAIISGLPQSHGIIDVSLVESFCEQNLTVKPRIVRARRFGRNCKVCVTLDSAYSLEDMLECSTLLKSSSDASLRTVFFNRDLTPNQAEATYKKRCDSRASRSSSAFSSSAPFPTAS